MEGPTKLTNLQSEILKVFSFELSEQELKEIKGLLAKYFADKATSEMETLWVKNNWNDATLEQWSKEHLRTKYE